MPQDKPEYREEIRKIDEQITALLTEANKNRTAAEKNIKRKRIKDLKRLKRKC